MTGYKDLKLRIGIKYCGGCNPEYDRVALIKQIQERLEVKADFVPWEREDIDLVLVVCGCSASCVDLSHFAGLRILTIKDREDGGSFLREINPNVA